MTRKVAIVTGANRGIGLAVVKRLCREFPGDVILTARNTEKGLAAVNKLKQEGLNLKFHELDLTQNESVRMLREFILSHYGGIDILVNNAALSFEKDSKEPMNRQAVAMVATNFKDTLNVCDTFLPLLRPHSRVIIMSSNFGKLKHLGPELREQLNVDTITLHGLNQMMDMYIRDVRGNVQSQRGWPESPIVAIRVFQVALAKVLARDLKDDIRRNILVNACFPGWTLTEATRSYLDEDGLLGGNKPRDPDDSAVDIVWLAMLPPGTASPNGELVYNRKILSFTK